MIAALTVALTLGTAAPREYCLIEVLPLISRQERTSFAVLRATTDSIADGEYYYGRGSFVRAPVVPGQRPVTIFGQVFELVSVEGAFAADVLRHRRVLVVWWTLGAACQRAHPDPVRLIDTGSVFVLGRPRPPNEWVAGVPTYDITLHDYFYAPGTERGRLAADSFPELPVPEFVEMFRRLPPPWRVRPHPRSAYDSLLAWGAADSSRWSMSPSRAVLCHALAERGSSTRCPSPRAPHR